MPELASIGIHVALDMGGQARFGPDAEWIDEIDYGVDPARAEPFYAAIRRHWPALPDGALAPAYAGIRPKLQAPRPEEHTSELQSLMRISYAVFCLKTTIISRTPAYIATPADSVA